MLNNETCHILYILFFIRYLNITILLLILNFTKLIIYLFRLIRIPLISFNLCFSCIIRYKLISSIVELDKITFLFPFSFQIKLCYRLCSVLFFLFYFPAEFAFRWLYIVHLDCHLFVLFHTFPNYIRLYNLIKLNNVLCTLSFELLYATRIYTYLLCALPTESSNITRSNIFILFWLIATCKIKKNPNTFMQ